MDIYVDANAKKEGNGSGNNPFQRIQQAADIAQAGDTVYVMPGIYRENVNPANAGKEDARITYISVEPLAAVIKGSERVKNWKQLEDHVWKISVPNSMFTERNPFTTLISGDWYMANCIAHTGDVFLNGKSMYEVTDLQKVYQPEMSKGSWDPDFSLFTAALKLEEIKRIASKWNISVISQAPFVI